MYKKNVVAATVLGSVTLICTTIVVVFFQITGAVTNIVPEVTLVDTFTSTTYVVEIDNVTQEEFLITGTFDVTTDMTSVVATKILPDYIGWSPGETTSTLLLQGKISYGIGLSDLPDKLVVVDGAITLPRVRPLLYSVEPDLSTIERELEQSFFVRLHGEARTTANDRALAKATQAMRSQGYVHLEKNIEPQLHTAHVMAHYVNKVAEQAGVEVDTFHYPLGVGTYTFSIF
jgi:hypothetical protein